MKHVPFANLLLDVDGTLISSNAAHADAWTRSLREHGVKVDAAQVRPLIGMGGDKLLPAIANVSEDSDRGQAITRRKKEIFGTLLPFLQPTPGARSLLEFLREQHVQLVIASSADDSELSALLQRAGVDDLIPRRTSKDDAAGSKPDPDIVQAALVKSGARHERTAMIGDTPYDVQAATRAGIKTIALRCGGYWSDNALHGAAEIFDDPEELLAHWRSHR